MAGSVNKVILVGNLGKDPEVRRLSSGEPVVNLRIATSESWKEKATGERRERTEWHSVVAWQRLAEIIGQKAKEEALYMARLLVSKADHELLGATEFEIRERVHKLGAHAIETAVNQRKKGGTKARA